MFTTAALNTVAAALMIRPLVEKCGNFQRQTPTWRREPFIVFKGRKCKLSQVFHEGQLDVHQTLLQMRDRALTLRDLMWRTSKQHVYESVISPHSSAWCTGRLLQLEGCCGGHTRNEQWPPFWVHPALGSEQTEQQLHAAQTGPQTQEQVSIIMKSPAM